MKKVTLAKIKPVKLNIPDLSHLGKLGGEKKIRKPRTMIVKRSFMSMGAFLEERVILTFTGAINLKEAKRLHKWLGRAIAYLEQK